MGTLIKPKINRIFTTKITQLIKDLNKRTIVYAVQDINTRCPNCVFDPVTKTSSGKYKAGGPSPFTGKTCPVCDGLGSVTTEKKNKLECTVKFIPNNKSDRPMDEGDLPSGSARIKALVRYHDTIVAATYFLIDNVRYSKIDGETGEPNRRGLQTYVATEIYVKLDK